MHFHAKGVIPGSTSRAHLVMDFNMTEDLLHVGHFCRQHAMLIDSLDIRLKQVLDKKEFVMLQRISEDLLDHCYVQLDSMIERIALWFAGSPKHTPPKSKHFAGDSRKVRPPHPRPSFSPSTLAPGAISSTTPSSNRLPERSPTPKPLYSVPFVSQRKRIYQFDMMYFGGSTIITRNLGDDECKLVLHIYKSRVWDGRVPNYAGLELPSDVVRFSILESKIMKEDFPDWNSTFRGNALECMFLNRSYSNQPVRSRRADEVLPAPSAFVFTLLAGLIGGIVAAVSASYAVEQLTDITENSDQAENIQVLQSHQTRLQIDDRSIRILNTTMTRALELVKQNTAHISAIETLLHLGYTASGLYDEINRLTRAWNALAMHRITPDVFKSHGLTKSLDKIEDFLGPRGYALGLAQTTDVFNCDVSTLVHATGYVQIILHLPTFKIGSQMNLLEVRSLPIHFDSGKEQNQYYFWPDFDFKYLAVSEDEKSFRTFTEGELGSCGQIGDIFFCDSNIIRLAEESSCVVALYKQDLKKVKDECRWTVQPAGDHAEHIGLNLYALYQSSAGQIDQFCPKEPQSNCAMSVSGLVKFKVKEGCTVRSRSYIFESGIGVTVKEEAYRIRNFSMNDIMLSQLYKEERDLMSPEELNEAIVELGIVGKPDGLKITQIKDLYTSRKRSSQWTWGLGTFAGIALCIGLVLILFKIWRCTSRSSARHMRNDLDLLRSDLVRRGQELDQQCEELHQLAGRQQRRGGGDLVRETEST